MSNYHQRQKVDTAIEAAFRWLVWLRWGVGVVTVVGEWVGGGFGVTEWRGRFGGACFGSAEGFRVRGFMCGSFRSWDGVPENVCIKAGMFFWGGFLGKIWVVERG